MIRLKILGTPGLQRDDGPPEAGLSQRRPIALLALLAMAGERGVSRDKLIAFLWPERDDEHARHVLAQTLYKLRRDLGGADPVLGTSDLRLNSDAIRCDVAEFEAAVADGDAERAAALYDGPLLDGFYISGAPEFERWAETERARLSATARSAFERTARSAMQAGDPHRAVEWWRRVAAIDPLDANAAIGLMESLAATGDRSGALRQARVYEALIEEELGVSPNPEIAALVDRLRSTGYATAEPATHAALTMEPDEPSRPDPPATGPSPDALRFEDSANRRSGDDLPATTDALSAEVPALRHRVRTTVTLSAALVVALAGWVAIRFLSGRRSALPAGTLVSAVGAVRDYTGSDSSGIARALTDMLATNLARVPNVRVVSNARIYEILGRNESGGELAARLISAARLAGAAEIVEGGLFRQSNGALRFDIRRVDLATGSIRKAYSVIGSDPFELVDHATAELAADISPGSAPDLRIADVTTRSLVAYRFYEQGLHAFYQQSDVPAARRLFLAALAEDSTFAMAEYYVANCEIQLGLSTAVDRFAHAAQLSTHATDRERLLIRAMAGYYWNQPSYRMSAETLATRYPDEPDGHFLLGQALAWSGDFLAGVPHLRRVVEMDSASLHGASIACRACNALDAMMTAYWMADSLAASERVALEWTRLQPGSPRAWVMYSGLLFRAGRDDDTRNAMERAVQLQGRENDWRTDVQIALRRGEFTAADSILARTGLDVDDGDVRWFRILSLRYQGRFEEALAIARQSGRSQTDTTAAARLAEAITLFDMGRYRQAATIYDRIAAIPVVRPELDARVARDRAWNLTHEATALTAAGDTAAVAVLVDTIRQVGALSVYGRDRRLYHYVRGLLLRSRGEMAEAAEELRQGIFSLTDGYTRNSYELARTLTDLHRPAEAIAVLEPAFRGSLEGSNTYVTHTELHEALALAFDDAGQPDSAAVHYAYVVRAWSAADPSLQSRRDKARARLQMIRPGS